MNRYNRRRFLKNATAGTLAFTASHHGLAGLLNNQAKAATKPNILVILVDEMRNPWSWIPASVMAQWMPNLNKLFSQSVNFQNHYTAATACSPSRGSLLTGLYAHQHGLLNTIAPGSPKFNPAYPTYGSVLRDQGYDTWWWGKFHLAQVANADLTPYGFKGKELVDPIGYAGEGLNGPVSDQDITNQFETWLKAQPASENGHWCTTVSYVNPHDVEWFWTGSDCFANEFGPFGVNGTGNFPSGTVPNFLNTTYFNTIASVAQNLNGQTGYPCTNFEIPGNPSTYKPSLYNTSSAWADNIWGYTNWDISTLSDPSSQFACIANAAQLPPPGSSGQPFMQPFNYWYKLLQLYMYLHNQVDKQIGAVLTALENSPFADNTVVVFTSDHGEYAGAHGLRGKLGTTYREALQIPLSVKDPTGQFINAPGGTNIMGYTSSVDVMPLILTLAANGSTKSWTQGPLGSYLSGRLDLSALLADPGAPGRSYVLHTTDETCVSPNSTVPFHVIGYRTSSATLGAYSTWLPQSFTPNLQTQEYEFYDYTSGDTSEVNNLSPANGPLQQQYFQNLFGPQGVFSTELQAPLPEWLKPAQAQAMAECLAHYKLKGLGT